jgi:hypothetical protein
MRGKGFSQKDLCALGMLLDDLPGFAHTKYGKREAFPIVSTAAETREDAEVGKD